jgi:ADP-heptose:LPS heptosyltransferase
VDRLRRLDPAIVVSAQFNPVRYADWIVRALPGAFAAGFGGGAAQEVPGARALEPQLDLPEARPFDLVVACDEAAAETDKARRLLAALTGRTPPSDPPSLIVTPATRERAAAVLRSLGLTDGGFAVCYPAGTKNVTIKAWPAERYGGIAAWLVKEKRLPTLVMGHASETAVVDQVVAVGRAAGADVRAWSAGDGELETMIGLLASAFLYFGNDTGAMHIAAAAGVPVVAVFGGGHWPRFLPVASRGAVHTRMLPCFGCGWKDCVFFDGPCVHRVEEDDVRASILRSLEGRDGFEVHAEPLPLGEADWARAVAAFRALSSRAADLRGKP